MKKIIIAAIILVISALTIFIFQKPETIENLTFTLPRPTTSAITPSQSKPIQIIAENLDTPWDIAFLPDGDMLVTERKGTLRVIGKEPVEINVASVVERGESGLTGLALHPDYAKSKFLYLYFSTLQDGRLINKIVRYTFDTKTLSDPKTIVDAIPGGNNHNGGRLGFGPDKKLYILTGDASDNDLAQNTNSLAGKILRVNDDGSTPVDNPFGNLVYSYGHRNPQGLAWDKDGGLWITEHGRSGILSGYDEINFIEKGANYGWPVIQGNERREGMKTPAIHSGSSVTWAPSGLAYINDTLYFSGLRGQTLYSVKITSAGRLEALREHYKQEYGRLRAAVAGSDGFLYISTSNFDGRGQPSPGDDKIIKIDPETLKR